MSDMLTAYFWEPYEIFRMIIDLIKYKLGLVPKEVDEYWFTFGEIVEQAGFKYETHNVTTDDGYILTLFRLKTLHDHNSTQKPAVFMQHGLSDTAVGWVVHTADKAPAFRLASEGYDVWLGN